MTLHPRSIHAATALLALASLLVLAACQTPLERAYGRSVAEHKARSIENPEAGQTDAVVATDGYSTENALERHREVEQKVEESQPKSVITINSGD